MPDNRGLLKERLGEMELVPGREEEILHELGDHLEDHAAALQAGGLAPADALQRALDSVFDWPAFRAEILSTEAGEEDMNYRTKTFWLPGFVALILSSGLLALLQYVGFVPHFYWLSGQSMSTYPFFTFYLGWLITLPIVGAIAAFWSQRAGGRVPQRLLAALAPTLGTLGFLLVIPLISFLLVFLPGALLKPGHGHTTFSLGLMLLALLTHFVSWVLVPSIGLFIGAAPFLRKPHPQA